MFRFRVAIALSALVVPGCATDDEVGGAPNLQITQLKALPAPTRADIPDAALTYLIGPRDELSVSVFGTEDFSVEGVVDPAGGFAVPLIGTIRAMGHTPAEFAARIEDELRERYVREPRVTVNLVKSVSHTFTIEGEVRLAGQYPATPGLTLLRSLAIGGSPEEFANLKDVLIFRTVAGQDMVGVYDVRAIRSGRYADPAVYADDLVVVGDSPRRRALNTILQLAPGLLNPVVLLLTR